MCFYHANHDADNSTTISATIESNSKVITISGAGNGPLDALSNALRKHLKIDFEIFSYTEHSLERSSSSKAAAYIGIKTDNEEVYWGAGVDANINTASVYALTSAVNRMLNK
jgi:2-isopropylmalate synthase